MADKLDGPPTTREIDDITCVAYFLLGARKEMFNSHSGEDALKAFCRLTGLDEARFKLKTSGFIP